MNRYAYYNENDPKAAAWLRELIKDKHIPNGEVDERDIRKVTPADLEGFIQCHFFAGIGGWPYALRLSDWPDDEPVWTGSCPCQPFSCAGKGYGTDDERHLWPAFRWLVAQRKPPIVFGEQVASAAGRDWLAGIRSDLEAMGYEVGAADLCAAGVGAPHIRQRLFWVADRVKSRLEGYAGNENRGSESRREQAETAGSVAQSSRPVWTQCELCEDYFCNIHDQHVFECGCQCIEWWAEQGMFPYTTTVTEYKSNARSKPWLEYIWWPCADGVYRRVPGKGMADIPSKRRGEKRESKTSCSERSGFRLEIEPSLFPLADGVPGRVGLLRGAGNAIVPAVAKEFIEAYRAWGRNPNV